MDADEIDTLLGFLRYQRDTFRWKTGGLTSAQLAQTAAPSDMTLGGMIKHLALVEGWWFHQVLVGADEPQPWSSVDWKDDPDWEWHTGATDEPGELAALYEDSVRTADSGIERAMSAGGFDALSVKSDGRTGKQFTLRWIVTHMIEEYARHNGHADLIRQSIDARVGE
ncbi:DinB family protein [Flexivirga lutea]